MIQKYIEELEELCKEALKAKECSTARFLTLEHAQATRRLKNSITPEDLMPVLQLAKGAL